MKLNIKNTEVELKSKFRTYLIYELIANKSFAPKSLMDMMIYLYATILANKPDIELTFDELIDSIDEDPQILTTFNEWVELEAEKQKVFKTEDSKKK